MSVCDRRIVMAWLAFCAIRRGKREERERDVMSGVVGVTRPRGALPFGGDGPTTARRLALLLLATLAVCASLGASGGALGSAGAAEPVAHASRTVNLNESGRLQLTSKSGFTLNERGSASGTITGSIYIHLHLVSSSRVTAEVSIFPSNGSLSGTGSASYHVNGGTAAFSGTLAITRGTGKYAQARASSLAFSGTIQRRNDAVTVRLSGPLSD
jgi:hypothetical protein